MAPKHYTRHRHLVPSDAIVELRRARAKVGSKPDGMNCLRLLEKKGSIDEVYKNMLLSLLSMDDKTDLREVKTESDDVVELMERPVPFKNRKRRRSSIDQHDDRGKARASEKNKAQMPLGNDHCLRLSEKKGSIDAVYKNMLLSLLSKDNKTDLREVKTESDDVELMERPVPFKNRKRKCSSIYQHDDHGRGRISEKNKALVSLGNDHVNHRNIGENKQLSLMRFLSDHVAQVQPVKMHTGKIGGKFKGVVKQEHEANEKKPVVKKENGEIQDRNSGTRYFCQDVGRVRGQTELRKAVRGDSSKKTAFGNFAVKKEPDHCVETRLLIKGIHSQVRNVKRAKCSPTYNSDEQYLEEGEGSSNTVPEVIILDSDSVYKKKIVSPFVSSKRYHRSMAGEESKNSGLRRTIDGEFRKELLKVLRKPFDNEELQRSRKVFRSGSYAYYHPDVQRKLTKYRYKREKCLIILRGFLFWLQNLSREGVFRPWKDKQYLQLELPSR